MNIDDLRKICLSFPGAAEKMQWESLLFTVAGKMFAITPLEPARTWLSLKADPEEFTELCERAGVIPAPYLARAKWIAIESRDALPPAEVAALLKKSYDLVVAKLPRTVHESLSSHAAPRKRTPRKTSRRKKRH